MIIFFEILITNYIWIDND